jgi:DNA polymerase-1
MKKNLPKILIFDGNAIIHRSFHALPPTLKTKTGQLVNAVYGFTSFLLKAIEEFKPAYLVLTLDQKAPTFRHKEYAAYKATRVKAPDELYEQIPIVIQVAKTLGLPIYTLAGFEADDLIGTISRLVDGKAESIVITGDMDTLQLIDDHTKVYTMSRGLSDAVTYDAARVVERYGLRPDQMIDYKGLRGDPSDNLPGVKGVGEKTASVLLQKYGALEKIYDALDKHPEDFKGALGDKLRAGRDDAYLTRKLATIDRQAPIEFSLDDARWDHFDKDAADMLFRELEFKSLLPRLLKLENRLSPGTDEAPKDKFARDRELCDYQIITTDVDFQNFLKQLKKQKIFALDTETTGLDFWQDRLLGLSFSWKKKTGFYLALPKNQRQDNLFSAGLHPWLKDLKPILEDPAIKKIGHNMKFDYHFLKHQGIEMENLYFDTMIASYLLAPDNRQHNLDALSWSELSWEKITHEDLFGKDKKNLDFAGLETDKLGLYSAEDSDCCWQLYELFDPKLKTADLEKILHDFEMPLIPVLADMENTGITLNNAYLKTLEKELTGTLDKLTKKIYKLAGEEFNINSPKQLQEILFDGLKLDVSGIKKTKTGLSTADDELDKLAGSHAIIAPLREYRELSKLNQTYVQALPQLVNPVTRRLHTNYNQTVAATGRLSSNNPNLQNIPTRGDWGQRVRQAFTAAPDKVLLSLDYSQIELRLAAHFADDKKMIEAFKAGADIHASTAAEINQVPFTEVTPEMRREAKAVNFGLLYGQGPYGLSQGAGISLNRAKDFINKYFTAFEDIKKFIDETIEAARRDGYVTTLFGRKRLLPDIDSTIPVNRKAAERMAVNTPLQGTAADLIKKAMIDIFALMKDKTEIRMLLQVHDELIFEVETDKAHVWAKKIAAIMEDGVKLKVPITVSAKSGKNWGELKPLDL